MWSQLRKNDTHIFRLCWNDLSKYLFSWRNTSIWEEYTYVAHQVIEVNLQRSKIMGAPHQAGIALLTSVTLEFEKCSIKRKWVSKVFNSFKYIYIKLWDFIFKNKPGYMLGGPVGKRLRLPWPVRTIQTWKHGGSLS